MHEITVTFPPLNRYKVVRASNRLECESKAENLLAKWEEEYRRALVREEREVRREQAAERKRELEAESLRRTAEAEKKIGEVRTVLVAALNRDHRLNWDNCMDSRTFDVPRPSADSIKPPAPREVPRRPEREDRIFRPHLWFKGYISRSERQRRENDAEAKYQISLSKWESQIAPLQEMNGRDRASWEAKLSAAVAGWEAQRERFIKKQRKWNVSVEATRDAYSRKDEKAIAAYARLVLQQSEYLFSVPKKCDVDYSQTSRRLVVDYELPNPTVMPSVKEVRFIKSKGKLRKVPLPDKEAASLYDDLIHQVLLRSIYELFSSDTAGAIDLIAFNGWVEAIDKRTGKTVRSCILSVVVDRQEFYAIELLHVNAKECFRGLKGIGSAELVGQAGIAPLILLSRDDTRFIAPKEVLDQVHAGVNLATMSWEDFEHLVRELFEKEFAAGGGEVKVTQASRDGGVDAIAFDPDPIRGGKIVIQAKRYARTVNVSAVRDLWGTVQHEGAMKGILVTTSDHGRDAHEFAKGKPISLFNGAHLLHMLEKHGQKARINLTEAIALLNDKRDQSSSQ